MMLLVIIWMVFGIIATIIARSKGLKRPVWLLAGILLGPAGLIIIALKPVQEPGGALRREAKDILAACVGCAGLVAVAGIVAMTIIGPLPLFESRIACREFVEIQDEYYWSKKIGKPPHMTRNFHVVFLNAEPPRGGKYVFSAFPGDKVLIIKITDNGYLCFDRRTRREGWIKREDVVRTLFLDDDTLRPCNE